MARPRGLRLSRAALNDILRLKRMTLTEAAAAAKIPLTTLSGAANGDHGASMTTARRLAEALEVDEGTLFPELAFASLREAS